MDRKYYEIREQYVPLDRRVDGLLREPVEETEKKKIAFLIMHSDGSYFGFPIGIELAKRGYITLTANVSNFSILEDRILDAKTAMDYLKSRKDLEKIILVGHSGGASLMSAYQCVAENGASVFQDDDKIIKMSDVGELEMADGVVFLDSNWGNGVMTLVSVDPAIEDETGGMKLNKELDMFDPENGYKKEGSCYSDAFIEKFQKAQGERNNRLIDHALERLREIEAGNGAYVDDEPLIIPAAWQLTFNNKMYPEDIRLLSHTEGEYPLLHGDGSVTNQVIYSRRKPRGGMQTARFYGMAALKTSVRQFLTSTAIRVTDDYKIDETGIHGIDWPSSYCCTPGNVMNIGKVPALVMGMTAGYEYLASEIVYRNLKSEDKTIAFVEGANHQLVPERDCETTPGEFGDTLKTLFDYVSDWIDARF